MISGRNSITLVGDVVGGGPWDGINETPFPLPSGQQLTHDALILIRAHEQTCSGQIGCEIAVPSPGRIARTVVTSGGESACPAYLHRITDRLDDPNGIYFQIQYLNAMTQYSLSGISGWIEPLPRSG